MLSHHPVGWLLPPSISHSHSSHHAYLHGDKGGVGVGVVPGWLGGCSEYNRRAKMGRFVPKGRWDFSLVLGDSPN